jgi:tRNA U34 5-methylaminomethyl-2-thiouridine-forming methyltransferase MnmC
MTGDGSPTLFHPGYDQTFRSLRGASAESMQVFLRNSRVADRLAAGQPTSILEIGFGTGLNFLLTAVHAQTFQTALTYCAIERELIDAETFRGLWSLPGWWPGSAEEREPPAAVAGLVISATEALRGPAVGPSASHSTGRTQRRLITEAIDLSIVEGDATRVPFPVSGVQAIYLDGFSPQKNPELWTIDFLRRLVACLAPGGRLVSFSVQGAVRRDLQSLGLDVQRLPGPPGGKRHCLVAIAPAANRSGSLS